MVGPDLISRHRVQISGAPIDQNCAYPVAKQIYYIKIAFRTEGSVANPNFIFSRRCEVLGTSPAAVFSVGLTKNRGGDGSFGAGRVRMDVF